MSLAQQKKRFDLIVEPEQCNASETFECAKNGNSYIDITHSNSSNDHGPVVSLFTGAGGMEIGLERAGFCCSVCVEVNADCRETLLHNRPNWKLFDDDKDRLAGDIRSIAPTELLAASGLRTGDITLVTGGAPCQPFSNMGRKQGASDPQNGDLFLEFVKVVKGVKPKGFIFENVVGITQNKHAEVIDYMRHQFDGLGYETSFEVINAADYGVPQQRKRFIMLGLLGQKPSFPLPTHYKSIGDWHKFTSSLNEEPTYLPSEWVTVKQAFDNLDPKDFEKPDCLGMKHADYMKKRMSMIKPGQNFKVLPMSERPKCWQTGKHQGHDTFGRIDANKPSPTIRTAGYNPTKGRYIHPVENRGLNTAEMASLQTFPMDWTFCTTSKKPSIVSIGKQIGNAVPPLLAEALGKALALQIPR